jgi:hypothetical protein
MKEKTCGARDMNRVRAIAYAAVVALALVGPAARAAPPLAPPPAAPPTVTGGDKLTLQQLHQANQTAMQMARLALTKGSTRPIRDFARTLVDEHTLTTTYASAAPTSRRSGRRRAPMRTTSCSLRSRGWTSTAPSLSKWCAITKPSSIGSRARCSRRRTTSFAFSMNS